MPCGSVHCMCDISNSHMTSSIKFMYNLHLYCIHTCARTSVDFTHPCSYTFTTYYDRTHTQSSYKHTKCRVATHVESFHTYRVSVEGVSRPRSRGKGRGGTHVLNSDIYMYMYTSVSILLACIYISKVGRYYNIPTK